jgi:AraC-like DNA-binding protein
MIRLKNNKIFITRFPVEKEDKHIKILSEKLLGMDDFFRTYYFAAGTGEIFFGNKDSLKLYSNTVLMLNRSFRFKFTKGDLQGFCICTKKEVIDELLQGDGSWDEGTLNKIPDPDSRMLFSYIAGLKKLPLYFKIITKMLPGFQNFYTSLDDKVLGKYHLIPLSHYANAYRALMMVNGSFRNKNKITSLSEQIYLHVKNYVEKHFILNFKLDDIAKSQPYSVDTFRKIFKQYHGDSIINYRNELRIKKAKSFLKDKDMRIITIAQECGFKDIRNFNILFKRVTGKSPKHFR